MASPQAKYTNRVMRGISEQITFVIYYVVFVGYPMGQLPVLEVDGIQVYQSTAVARYVAKVVGLAGKNDWENLLIDIAVDNVNDFRTSELYLIVANVQVISFSL